MDNRVIKMMFGLNDVLLGIEDAVKITGNWTDVELGRPQYPTLYGDNKIFIWGKGIPLTKEEIGGEYTNAQLSYLIVPIVAGTDRAANIQINDDIDLLFDTLEGSNLGLRGCKVILPSRGLLDIKPASLNTTTKEPTLCMSAVINLTVKKTGG